MKHVESLFGQLIEKSDIANQVSKVLFREQGNIEHINNFHKKILSCHPRLVAEALTMIPMTDIPVTRVAHDLDAFMGLPHFHDGRHDDIINRWFSPINPPDRYLYYQEFFDSQKSFEESFHYLKFVSLGLQELSSKVATQVDSGVVRTYTVTSIKQCLVDSAHLVDDSVYRDTKPVDEDFLSRCSFGSIWSDYFSLLANPIDQRDLYTHMADGMLAVYMKGSSEDRTKIAELRQQFEFKKNIFT